MTILPRNFEPVAYLGGMRWWPKVGREESPDASWPLARLTLTRWGVSGGPSARFVPLIPTLEYRWEDLTLIEPVTWFVPLIGEGVRFRSSDTGFIFWCGGRSRGARILNFCDAAAPGLVTRTRRRAPLYAFD